MTGRRRPPAGRSSQADTAEAAAEAARQATAVDIDALVRMDQEAVWMLQKRLLRQHFLTLQGHLRLLSSSSSSSTAVAAPSRQAAPPLFLLPPAATAVTATATTPSSSPSSTSRLLSLPPEIRRLILLHLLGPAASSPVRGPHPRSLQSPLFLSRALDPAVLRACRQLHAEGCAVLYGAQPVHAHVDFDVWTHRRDRSDLAVGPAARQSLRDLHVHVFLGSEKRLARPAERESRARLEVVRKGVRKLVKWLAGPPDAAKAGWRLQTLRISWQEPPQTYTWEQKKSVLDEFRAVRPYRVEAGEINWGLRYPGKKYRFVKGYLHELSQVRGGAGGGNQHAGEEVGRSGSAAVAGRSREA